MTVFPAGSTTLIGIDVGTTGLKAIAISPAGEVTGRAEVEYPLSTPRPGWAEQHPDDWWRAAQAALHDLGARHVAGIGLSGQMHGLVVLDEKLHVLRPAILWNDQRTAAECAEIDFVDALMGAGFAINNPNVVAACGCGSSFQAKDDVEGEPAYAGASDGGGCGSGCSH